MELLLFLNRYHRNVATVVSALLMSGITSCTGHDSHNDGQKKDHEDTDEIILSPQSAARLGVVSTPVDSCMTRRILPVWGVLESQPGIGRQILSAKSSGIIRLSSRAVPGATLAAGERIADINGAEIAGGDLNAIAATELEAAKKELARIEPLRNDGIVSEKDYQAALANVKRLKASYAGVAVGSVVTAPQKSIVTQVLVTDGEWVEAGTPIMETTADSRLLLRVDVPLSRRDVVAEIIDANFRTADRDDVNTVSSLGGKLLTDMHGSSASNGGYMPVYFSLSNDGTLSAGMYADVWLVLSSEKGNVKPSMMIPNTAVIENEGEYFAYVKIDDHGYEKRHLTLGVNDGKNIEVKSGLSFGDNLVTEGAMIVKMAENNGKVPEGHTHNH